jgi:hypothetical protein
VGADGGVEEDSMDVQSRSSKRADPLKLQGGDDLQVLDERFTIGMWRRSNTMTAAFYDVEGVRWCGVRKEGQSSRKAQWSYDSAAGLVTLNSMISPELRHHADLTCIVAIEELAP